MLVQTLMVHNWIEYFAILLSHIEHISNQNMFLKVLYSTVVSGWLSVILANFMNNKPMTIFFTRILLNKKFDIKDESVDKGALYGMVMGSNYCANFSILGALAGIMWVDLLKAKGV